MVTSSSPFANPCILLNQAPDPIDMDAYDVEEDTDVYQSKLICQHVTSDEWLYYLMNDMNDING